MVGCWRLSFQDLEQEEDQVQFLASLNRPPYVSARLQEVKWTDCLVNISYFLGLLSRASFRDLLQQLYHLPKKEATACLIKVADPARLVALALDNDKPEQWIDVAPSPQEVGRNYTPQGSVAHMDVFHCDPLEFLNVTPQEWQQRLSPWRDSRGRGSTSFTCQASTSLFWDRQTSKHSSTD